MQTNPLAAMAGRVKPELAGRQLPRCDDGAGASFDQLLRDKAASADASPGPDAAACAGTCPRPGTEASAAADGSVAAASIACRNTLITGLSGQGESALAGMLPAAPSPLVPSRGLSLDGGTGTADGTSSMSMPAILAAGAKAGWPRAAKPLTQDDGAAADSAMAALADAGSRGWRAVPADTALPPGAAAAPPDPSATVARCEAMLRYGVAPAGLQGGTAWEVMLNDANSIPMTVRAQRSDVGVLGSVPQAAWTLAISTPAIGTSALGTPALDAALLQRHVPRLLERLKSHALAPGHVRIEAEDDGR